MGSGERSVSRRRVTAGAEGHREGFVPDHPRIAVLGSRSTFTAHAVSTLCARGVPPVALMGDADPAPRARGEIPVEVRTPAARIAAAHGIALIREPDPNHPDAIAALERVEPDLLLLACLPYVVGRETRRAARLGALNLHPSALPRFRGPDPVFWQLRAGVDRAGVTLHVATGVPRCRSGRRAATDPRRAGDQRGRTHRGPGSMRGPRPGGRTPRDRAPHPEAVPQDESVATRQPRPCGEDFRIATSWTAERAYRFIEGVRGPGTTFTVLGDEGEIEVERAIGFDAPTRPGPAIERSGGTVTIRFAHGSLLAVPAPSSRD